jgi:hypothetical protein
LSQRAVEEARESPKGVMRPQPPHARRPPRVRRHISSHGSRVLGRAVLLHLKWRSPCSLPSCPPPSGRSSMRSPTIVRSPPNLHGPTNMTAPSLPPAFSPRDPRRLFRPPCATKSPCSCPGRERPWWALHIISSVSDSVRPKTARRPTVAPPPSGYCICSHFRISLAWGAYLFAQPAGQCGGRTPGELMGPQRSGVRRPRLKTRPIISG